MSPKGMNSKFIKAFYNPLRKDEYPKTEPKAKSQTTSM